MSNPYDFVQAPNIAGAGNYAQMLQQGLSSLGKPAQQQKPAQPKPSLIGATMPAAQPAAAAAQPAQQTYIQQLLHSLGMS